MNWSRFTLAAAVLGAASVSAHAETWFTDFDDLANLKGSFQNLTVTPSAVGVTADNTVIAGGAFVYTGAAPDLVLALPDASKASFSFSSIANDTPAFKVSFWTSSNASLTSSIVLTLSDSSGHTQTTTLGNVVQANSGPNPNPNGASYTYYFMNTVPTAGNWTLTFDNVPQLAGFRLDDVEVSAVPEPSAYLLAAMGVGALGVMSRRRSSRKA